MHLYEIIADIIKIISYYMHMENTRNSTELNNIGMLFKQESCVVLLFQHV